MARRKRGAPKFPLRFTVQVSGPSFLDTDRFGNARPVLAPASPLKVAGWAINAVDEKTGEQVLRTVDRLDLYTPQLIAPHSRVKLADGTMWEVVGNSEDYSHGPWWNLGLYVVHCTRVEG
ncbi:hypothetical protein FRC0497_02161 [Corynebacterium diphtheriae]|nr:hypothetical protein FRC0497_02161 [Corynebacterium diphtheriae]